MKSIDVTLQRTYLKKTANRNIVRHPAKSSLIFLIGLKRRLMQIIFPAVKIYFLKHNQKNNVFTATLRLDLRPTRKMLVWFN